MKGYKGRMLPCDECKGECCCHAPIEKKIWNGVAHRAEGADIVILWKGTKKEAAIASKPNTDGECWFLKDGRCSIYYRRPRSCRAVGVEFPCALIATEEEKQIMIRQINETRNSGYKFQGDK